MTMRWTLVGLMFLASPTPAAETRPAAPSSAPRSDDGTLSAREPYRFPFPEIAGWLGFVRGQPDGAPAADAFAALFSATDYADWAMGRMTVTSRITYRSGGLAIRGLLVEPRAPGRHPVIVYNHGGIGKYGRIVLWDILEMNRLAARGYVVLASQFRGEGGSEGRPDYGGGDAEDALALIRLAEGLASADASRAGMLGFSRGGLTTYAALARSRRIAAAVIQGGPVDLVDDPRRAEFDRFVYPDAVPGYRADPEGELVRRSPIRWPERLSPEAAILIVQGGDDPRVQPVGALAMAAALQRLHRPYRLKIYEGGSHDLLRDFADVRRETDRWFDRYVRDRVAPPANGVTTLPPEVTDAE